jgi:RNA polymerase sigma-70 factor (ECF subfamily)
MKSPSTASDAFRQLRISEQPKVFLPDRPECENKDRVAQDKEFFIRKTFEDNPEKGVELLFKFYYRPLCSHAARYVYSKELAEDLVGEVFERFWQKQLYAQVSTSFQAYLSRPSGTRHFSTCGRSSAKSAPRA